MKNFKHGFTLAEVLLCIAIIGIVIAMGMKITQNMTQRAYDKYWATGYLNLYDVLNDMNSYAGENPNDYWQNLRSQSDELSISLKNILQTYFSPAEQAASAGMMIFDFKHLLAVEEGDEGEGKTDDRD